MGVFAGNLSDQETEQTYSELLRLAEERQIYTPVRRVFSFTQVPEALNLLESRKQKAESREQRAGRPDCHRHESSAIGFF